MKVHKSITSKRIVRAYKRSMSTLDSPGFCVACGAEADGVEPDARKYECECCGEHAVYGVEELVMAIA